MTKSENGSEIFPVDSKGRVRVSRERSAQLLNEFEKRLSGAQFARIVGVKYQTIAFSRQERQRRKPVPARGSSQKKGVPVRWLETVISEAQASARSLEQT